MFKKTLTQLNSSSLPTLLGMAVMLLGITVLSGWIFHVIALVEIFPGFVAVVFNTALCFVLTGAALALPGLTGRPMPKLQTIMGSIIFILCALIFGEHLLDKSFGVDWAFLHTWFHDGNIRPGRLAPNTAIGFMLIGSTLILMNRVSAKWRAVAVQLLTISVLVIGLTGLVGYALAPDFLYGWARSARMAVPTALGMIVTSVALWRTWHRAEWYQSRKYFQEDEKIAFIGAAILAAMTITAGLTGFVFQQKILENTLKETLRTVLKSRVILFNTVVQQSETNTRNASNAFFLYSLPSAAQATVTPKQYNGIVNNLLGNGFRALAVYDLNGKQLASAGGFPRAPGIVADLHTPLSAKLLWDDGLYLQTQAAIVNGGKTVARLLALQPLSMLEQQIFDTQGIGSTVEIALCKSEEDTLLCFPEGDQPAPFRIKRQSALGQPLPMTFAVDGKSGIITSVDYRAKNVVAAYAPLAPGVGLVVKEDIVELYTVIHNQLKAVIPALLLLITLGAIFLRSQLRPIAARLLASESKAQEQEQEIKAVVGSVGEAILTIDERGIIESFNAAASKIFGYSAQQAIGKAITILMPPAMHSQHEQGMHRYLQGGEPHVIGRQDIELPGLRVDGTIFTLALTVNEISLDHRRLFVGIMRDITERKQMEEKLVFLAQNDTLTGLPNRSLFMDRLSDAVRRANRIQTGLAVMFLDLDGFKQINDTLGHHKGDELLKQLATRLTATVRITDIVARLGGDEFTVLLDGLAEPQIGVEAVADKIVAAIAAPFKLGENEVVVTTSIGLAIHIPGELNAEELLRRADSAMYKAKNSGKNRWCMCAYEDQS